MNIRPKNILYAYTGVKFSLNNLRGANWRQLVFNNYRLHLLDLLTKYGEAHDYGNWLNEMLSRHANLYKLAGNNWENVAYKNDLVGLYQLDYKGGLGNDGTYKRFGSVQINPNDRYDFNLGITPNYESRYNIANPPNRTSGDRTKQNYKVDNLYSAITDDRRILGRKGDWDETSDEYKLWQKDLNATGWETYLDTSDNYYKLRRLVKDPDKPIVLLQTSITLPEQLKKSFEVPATGGRKYGFDWSKISNGLQKVLTNPDLYATGRLAGDLFANEKIYGEALKGIRPNLMLTYQTHRLIVGDEATKQSFYRRAALGLTKASRPFTSDADRQMAYQFEAKRVGDELRAQGDLADNQEIRRTSDESNQHQWANQQRATEVANANNASINQANSLKHNLLALKHAAQWSSVDNFLKEIEYRKRQQLAEDLALDEQIWMLDLDEILYTPDYVLAYKKYNDVLEKHKTKDGYDEYNPDVMKARAEFYNFIKLLKKLRLLDYQEYKRKKNLLTAKSGTKVTYKKKDDLLYKSTRDVVEHFRRMSKMSSDAQNRKTPKIEKLTSHPKSGRKAWKFQLGGLAPFVVYTPVSMGGETSRTTSSDSSSTKSSSSSKGEKSDVLDMIKELFKEVVGKGLPSDVNSLYTSMLNFLSRSRMFGSELSTDDIASMYVLQMLRLNLVLYLKGIHNKAEESVVTNDAVNEFAVDFAGRLVAKDDEDNIVYIKSLKEAEEKGVTPLTNALLLLLRATLPSLAGRLELDSIAANGIGMSKIASFLKSLLPSLGSSESTIEGYTKKESNQIKAGLQLLKESPDLQYAPDGEYEYSKYTKDLQAQVKLAINYLKGILPNNMKKVIETRAELGNLTVDLLIGTLVGSGVDEDSRLLFTPVTGKAAKDSNGSTGSKNELEMNNALKLLTGAGEGHLETFGIGNNNVFLAIGRQSSIADASDSEKPFGADFSYNKIYESGVGRILDLDNASFGDVPINKTMKDSIIVDNSRIVSVDLPYTTTRDGRIIPDFKLLNKILEADEEILRQNLDPKKESDINKINLIYADKKLPIKYNSTNQLTGNYRKFAVILATAVEDVFLNKDGLETNATLTLVTDDNEKDKYVRLMSEITKDKKYSLNKPGIFNWGDKDIYKGSIFIPITGDIIDASLAGGASKVKTGMSDNYDTMRKAWQVRNYLEVPQVNFGN